MNHGMISYRDLKENINCMNDKQLDSTVTVIAHGEFYGILSLRHTTKSDPEDPSVGVLDEGHPWLVLNQ